MKVIRDVAELTDNAKAACELFLEECKRQGLNVLITETYRSQERQDYLYAQGRTRAGKKVTWTKNSRHTSRRAWDICKNVKGEEYSDTAFFKACGKIAKSLGITWGGEWKTPDLPHFEVSEDWRYDDMENLRKEIEALKEELRAKNKVYHYGKDVPEWAKPALWKAMQKGTFKGAAEDDLNVSEDTLKTLVFLDRLGLFDENY